MATFHAISAVSAAVVDLLESQYHPEDFPGSPLQFKLYQASDFLAPMQAGVSVMLYRLYPNAAHLSSSGHLSPPGPRQPPMLALDLHFLITAWAKDASLQQSIAGWMLRLLHDTPVLPAALLNQLFPDTFQPGETVELLLAELTTDELFRLWKAVAGHAYQISVPYIARGLRIDSPQHD
jgi:hypothetical protein